MEEVSVLELGQNLLGLSAQFWCEVNERVHRHPLTLEGRRLGGKRLRRRAALTWHRRLRHRTFLDRPDRFARHAVEHIGEPLLAHLRDRFDIPAIDRDVDQRRRRRKVVVPQPVVHHLKMPDPLTGGGIQTNQALREQIVAQPMPTVPVVGRGPDRQIHVAEFLVSAHDGPHIRVARIAPRVVLPGVVPELSGLGDRVERPE